MYISGLYANIQGVDNFSEFRLSKSSTAGCYPLCCRGEGCMGVLPR